MLATILGTVARAVAQSSSSTLLKSSLYGKILALAGSQSSGIYASAPLVSSSHSLSSAESVSSSLQLYGSSEKSTKKPSSDSIFIGIYLYVGVAEYTPRSACAIELRTTRVYAIHNTPTRETRERGIQFKMKMLLYILPAQTKTQ